MQAAKKARASSRGWVTRAVKKLQSVIDDDESDKVAYQDALEELNKRLQSLEKTQTEVELATESDDELEQEIDAGIKFYDKAQEVRTVANRNLEEIIRDESVAKPPKAVDQHVKLPKIQLPKFSGIITEWPSWWDQFKATIDRSDLPAITKMTYLHNLLEGESKSVIEGLTLTEKHYDIAKELLEERYGRRELIVFSHIQALINLKPSDTCKNNLARLKSIQDQVNVRVRSLEAFGVDGQKSGLFLTPMILSRLPTDVRMEWAREGQGKEDDLEFLLSFLKTEIERRERADTFKMSNSKDEVKREEKHQNKSQKGSTASALHTVNKDSLENCIFCHKSNHVSKDCWTANKLSTEDLKEAVMKARLCFRCLT